MKLSKRIEKLEAVTAEAEQMHVIHCQVGESDEAAQVRYLAETGAVIMPRDMVVMLQHFGDDGEKS